jgi:hypothetical protein
MTDRAANTDLHDEALGAARAAGMIEDGPASTHLLKKAKKSLVVRIAGHDRPPFVAKRTRSTTASFEHRVYAELLPGLPVRTLGLLGFIESDDKWSWLFLEDAGDLGWSTHSAGERRDVGIMLGRIMSVTATMQLPDWLPLTGVDHYRAILDTARGQLCERGADLPVVADVVGQLDRVERSWHHVSENAAASPRVLCHSDIRPDNIRLVKTGKKVEPVLLDWELAARGPSTIDLGCRAMTGATDPLIEGYRSGTGDLVRSPAQTLEHARSGRVFRLLNAVNWAAKDLGTASSERGESNLRSYVSHLERVLGELGVRP